MSFLIADAMAQGAGANPPPDGGLMSLLPLLLLAIVFYFLLVRPQQKRHKEHMKVVEGLQKGDEVQTESGIMGKVTGLGDNFAQVEIAKGVEVKIRRTAISQVMPKGTLKEL